MKIERIVLCVVICALQACSGARPRSICTPKDVRQWDVPKKAHPLPVSEGPSDAEFAERCSCRKHLKEYLRVSLGSLKKKAFPKIRERLGKTEHFRELRVRYKKVERGLYQGKKVIILSYGYEHGEIWTMHGPPFQTIEVWFEPNGTFIALYVSKMSYYL